MVGAAQESERIGGDGGELAGQPLGIAAMVIDQDGFRSWVHGFLVMAGNRASVPAWRARNMHRTRRHAQRKKTPRKRNV